MSDDLQDALKAMRDEMKRRSEIVDPRQSFWYFRPTRNFPPSAVRHTDQYDGSDRIAVVCTQTDLSHSAQKKLVAEWCEFLPTLDNVEYLWFLSRTTQEMFDAACEMPRLEGLFIKWSGIQSIRKITALSGLKHLHIGSSPSLTGLCHLKKLPELESLELANIREMVSLEFAIGMKKLRDLSLEGDSNSLKSITCDDLSPLSGLESLERLCLRTLRVKNESLRPLASLRNLKWLLLANKFRMEEFAALAGLLPNVDRSCVDPIFARASFRTCKKCGGNDMRMLTGKGKRTLCASCDASKIEAHIDQFNRIAEEAARERRGQSSE